MSIRTNTNPRPIGLTPELQDLLVRNGMRAQVVANGSGFALIVQGHDSPVLSYPISGKQLAALTDWGTNTANRKAYNTFASIVAADFDLPKDFVHARNANGRVAMGLHGYRIGAGEYGRQAVPFRPHCHAWGWSFLGWTPRQQDGFHLRRIGGRLYYPSVPIVPDRPDGRMKPGELQSGGYGFYYKGYDTAPVAQNPQDVLADLQTVITPISHPQRPDTPAIPYTKHITSDIYFTNEKWQQVLASHGILIDTETRKMTVQSSALPADLQYDLTEAEVDALTSNSVKEHPVAERLSLLNNVLKEDFAESVTMDMLNSDHLVDIKLHPEILEDLESQIKEQERILPANDEVVQVAEERDSHENLSKESVRMDGNDLTRINPDKGWFREGLHGREVTVDEIRVEPLYGEGETKYKMSAVIDGEAVSHEITQKQYDKFMAVDDYHRMKLFSKVFGEVDMKSRDHTPLGVKIGAALTAGLVVAHDVMRGRLTPDIYVEHHHCPGPRVYYKPGVDSPEDVAARRFDAMMNHPDDRGSSMGHGM